MLEIAKVTAKGQITIPIEIRKRLGVKAGDKILFLEEAGRIIFTNASMYPLEQVQKDTASMAAEEGVELLINQDRLLADPIGSRSSLSALLAKVTDGSVHDEVVTGGPTGREVW